MRLFFIANILCLYSFPLFAQVEDIETDEVLTNPSITTDFHFVEAQDEAMIDHYFSHDIFIGGGAAFFDYDNDGDDDLYITAGLEMDHFYENNGDGTFTDKSFQVGLLGTQYEGFLQ